MLRERFDDLIVNSWEWKGLKLEHSNLHLSYETDFDSVVARDERFFVYNVT